MEVKEFTDWSTGIRQKSAMDRIPISGTIEVTQRCNHTCVHCYNNLSLKDQAIRQKELTYKEHCGILDEIADAGCLWLTYTGGEIFARPDFLDIYTHAKQKGLLITLFTNGTLITPEIADYLLKYRPFAVEVTLYGRTRDTYEKITGMPGSFERCMQGIRLLKERELPLKLKTMAISLNKHELWDMKRFAENELGLEFRFDALINPRCDCSQSPLEVRLTPAQVVELDLSDPGRVAEWQRFAKMHSSPLSKNPTGDALWQCGGGLSSFAIDPFGTLRMCVLTQDDSYDLRTGNFKAGWEKALYALRQKKISKQTRCIDCAIRSMCGMCPANAALESMDPEAPVDFLCQVAHLRAYAFDIPLPPHGNCEYCPGGSEYTEIIRKVKKLNKDSGLRTED